MNPVKLAIEYALAVGKDRKGVSLAFDAELARLEFHPDAESVVLPVSRKAGLLWSTGGLDDFDLILQAGKPELIFAFLLPNLRTYRQGVEKARRIYQQGATGFITYTKTPCVLSHWLKFGCAVRHTDVDGGKRLFGGHVMVDSFFHDCLASANCGDFPRQARILRPFGDCRHLPIKARTANPVRNSQA